MLRDGGPRMNWLHLTASQFSIDPTSPSGLSRNGKPVGWDAGRYWRTKVKGKAIMCHVIIMMLKTGGQIPNGVEVDHIDRDGHNNRIENLRLVTRQGNVCNTSVRKDSKSGIKGVAYRDGRLKPYVAHKQRFGKRSSKSFKTSNEALEWLGETT